MKAYQQTENASKWLHTINFNEIEPFQKLLFVLSLENKNRRPYDDLYYFISELRDETYSSLSQTLESQNTIKMLTLSVFELRMIV